MKHTSGPSRKQAIQISFGVALAAVLIVSAWIAWGPGSTGYTDQSGVAYRVFSHIAIMVNGVNMTIPANIGVASDLWANHTLDQLGVSGRAPLYTQTGSGVIHTESKTVYAFVLGDFFNIWGQTLSDAPSRCVLSYCQSSSITITLFVNGNPPKNPQDPWRAILLYSRTDIFFRITSHTTS